MCNNRIHPRWGSVGTPFTRLFESGCNGPTMSARLQSIALRDELGFTSDKPAGFNNDLTTMSCQVYTHDSMKTKKAQHTTEDVGGGYNCCNPKNDTFLAGLIKMNPDCMPVDVPPNDFCFGSSVKSLNYIATFKALDDCKLTANPVSKNFETAFMDLNLIFGEESLKKLGQNGGKFNHDNFNEMKAQIVDYDERSMMLPGIFVHLSLFTRLYNFIFDELRRVKPFLTLTQLIFESRKFTTASYQKTILELMNSIMSEKIKFTSKTKSQEYFNYS